MGEKLPSESLIRKSDMLLVVVVVSAGTVLLFKVLQEKPGLQH